MTDRTRCPHCNGKGWNWQLPHGMNAFAMKMEAITANMRRVQCHACDILISNRKPVDILESGDDNP